MNDIFKDENEFNLSEIVDLEDMEEDDEECYEQYNDKKGCPISKHPFENK